MLKNLSIQKKIFLIALVSFISTGILTLLSLKSFMDATNSSTQIKEQQLKLIILSEEIKSKIANMQNYLISTAAIKMEGRDDYLVKYEAQKK